MRGSTYDGDGILADVLEPHVLDGAATADAVNALALVRADDDVLQRGARAQNENGVSLT